MKPKRKRDGKFAVRSLDDDFEYQRLSDHTPEEFRKRMRDRAIEACWDDAHDEQARRSGANVEELKRKRV